MIVKRLLIGLLVVGSILALSGCVSAIDVTPNISGIVQEEINQNQPHEYHDDDSGKPDSETKLAELVKKQLGDLSKKSQSELLEEMNKLIEDITNNQHGMVLALAGGVSAIEASVPQHSEIENWNYGLTNLEKQPTTFNIQSTGGLVIDIDTDSQLLKSNILNKQSFNVQSTERLEFNYPINIGSFNNIIKPEKDDSYT